MIRLFCSFGLLCLLNIPAYAQSPKEEFTDLVRSISVNGISMNSTVEEIDTYFEEIQADDKATCQIKKAEPRTVRKAHYEREYRWNCNKRDANNYESSWGFTVVYEVDRVKTLEYTGPLAPEINNKPMPEAIKALNEKLENNTYVKNRYTHYVGWGNDETANVYEIFTQYQNAICTNSKNEDIKYDLVIDMKYNDSPDRPVSTIKLRDRTCS
ncbi:MAG: hypothetical protein ACTHPO_12325 [Alphaproteobacteria bacterium]